MVHAKGHMPYAPVTFENAYDFWQMRDYTYKLKKPEFVSFLAEGIIGGKVVCSDKKMPSRRSTKIRLTLDSKGQSLVADGSDFIIVVAEITDDNGNVRRLAKDNIQFSVEGEGEIIGDQTIGANPRTVEWGSAPLLIRSTTKAGKIKVKAHVQFEGTQAPSAAEIEFESIPADLPLCLSSERNSKWHSEYQKKTTGKDDTKKLTDAEKQKLLEEVEKQQTEFGEKK